MCKVQRTLSGTLIRDGIEYNKYPPVNSIIKATNLKWAIKLRDQGILRLNSVEFYQKLESTELGDTNEGKGMSKLGGHPIHFDSTNEVFIWCAALPNTSFDVLKRLNPTYDTIIRIANINEFIHRISNALKDRSLSVFPHIGKVIYERGMEVTKEALNNQIWHYNVFQKSKAYKHQREYRLSFTNMSFQRTNKKFLDIQLGNCFDIVRIEETKQ